MPRKGQINPGPTDGHWLATERKIDPSLNAQWHNAVTAEPETWCDCADVSISVPVAWAGVVLYRVITRHGSVMHQAAAGAIPAGGLNLGGFLNQTILRIRGVRFDAVIVEVLAPLAPAAPLGVGTMRVESWARSHYPFAELLHDGRLMAEDAPSLISAPGSAQNAVTVSTTPIYLRKLHIYNPNAGVVFLHLWDAIAGTIGADPDFTPIPVPATSGLSVDFPMSTMATALTWTTSSAYTPYTVPNPATPLWVDTHYRDA